MGENDNVEKLTEEEIEETSGGVGTMGNITVTCACGLKYQSEKGWVEKHLKTMKHNEGTYYDSKGKKIGKTKKITYTKKNGTVTKITIKRPDSTTGEYPIIGIAEFKTV